MGHPVLKSCSEGSAAAESSMPALSLNDRIIAFEPGQTILEVARQNDVVIPTLCYLKESQPTGVSSR